MALKLNNQEDGLRELASMIAAAARGCEANGIVEPSTAANTVEINTINESEIIARIEHADSSTGCVYTETVSVENFMRNKTSKKYALVGARN